MEVDLENNLTNKIDTTSKYFFEVEYEGQTLKDNLKFESWKKKMLKKYGEKAKLYQCKYDNIYYYDTNENNDKISFNGIKCPLCKRPICYFCSKESDFNLMCCMKGKLYYWFFHDGFIYIDKEYRNIYKDEDFYNILKYFLIPCVTFFFMIGTIAKDLYHGLQKTYKPLDNYYFNDDNFSIFIVIVNVLIDIFLNISFFVQHLYFKIFLLFISIFFKNYPLKYYFGLIKGGWEDLR